MAAKPRGLLAIAGLTLLGLALSAGTVLAQQAQPQPVKPVAAVEIAAVTAKATDPNVLEWTLADGETKVQGMTTGLNNVPVAVPVTLRAVATNKAAVTKYTWTLSTPKASKAALSAKDAEVVKFTPDVSGTYKLDLVLANDAGSSPMASVQIHAGEYIGAGAGNCFKCHPTITHEWSKTGHSDIFFAEINGGENPSISHYGERCIRCHVTGYYPGAENGGFGDLQAKTGWKFPDLKEIQKGGLWDKVPVDLQQMANIQCEACHGPAKDHVLKGAPMAASLDDGVCGQCHDAGGHHTKGTEIKSAKHTDAESQSWTYPVGPSRQDCVRCHSGAGYVSFIQNPTNAAAWNNEAHTVGCSVCHDPHSDANKFQLRIVGKPVEAAGLSKDFGLSATCVECHNARTKAEDAVKGSFPHYSAAGEMLADTGGVTYGQPVPNSPHGMIIGTIPVANPEGGETPVLFGGAAPGPCVVCHMWPDTLDAKDPNKLKVGSHSFNTVSPDGKFQYTASCQPCHAGVKDFALQSRFDYDGNGKVESVQAEVKGLLITLQKAIADSGVKPVQGHPYFDRADVAKANDKQKNAIYNYLFVRGLEGSDGKAAAVHNFKRSVALLQLSYKDLTGSDVPNATLMR
ncbi:MAG: multiheme c-type cytochrome [Sphingomonadaceae bacterium]